MDEPAYRDRRRLGTWLCALALLAGVALLYLRSPIVTSLDSYFSLQVAASLLGGDHGELGNYRPVIEGNLVNGALRYQVLEVEGRLFSFYPIGAPLLAAPLLALADLFDPGLLERQRLERMPRLEMAIAASLASLAAALLFLALRARGFGLAVSLAGALTLALSTTLWSQASRGLWQHGPLLLAFSGLFWALAPPAPSARRWLCAGLCAGLAYLIRPSAAAALLPFGALALAGGWRATLAFGGGAAVGLGVALAYNLWAFGSMVPLYAQVTRIDFATLPERVAGLLVSPSRGLLVFSPVLLLAGLGLWRAWRGGQLRRLDWAILAGGLLQFGLIAMWPVWTGGHSYGPRLQTDLLPFAIWFLSFALAGATALRPVLRTALLGGFALLFAVGAAIHYRGAFERAVHRWNSDPGPVTTARAWDWSDPQFLRGW